MGCLGSIPFLLLCNVTTPIYGPHIYLHVSSSIDLSPQYAVTFIIYFLSSKQIMLYHLHPPPTCCSFFVPSLPCLPVPIRRRRPLLLMRASRWTRRPRHLHPSPSGRRGKLLTTILSQGASYVSKERCGYISPIFRFILLFPVVASFAVLLLAFSGSNRSIYLEEDKKIQKAYMTPQSR